MNALRNAITYQRPIQVGHWNLGLSSLLRVSCRPFSAEAEGTTQNSSTDQFLRTPKEGFVYGRLNGNSQYTTRTDIINLLEGCKIGLDDVKVDYNRSFTATGMVIRFPSQLEYLAALKVISRRNRMYRLDKIDRSQWDLVMPYDGKAVLLMGIPNNAVVEDVERFLSGCQCDMSSFQMFYRQIMTLPDPIRMALVHFPSKAHAIHAFITKNKGFCLNSQILMRLLQ
ncbi:hypothetical protein NMG60_11005452 [Bertholletia excelsa]